MVTAGMRRDVRRALHSLYEVLLQQGLVKSNPAQVALAPVDEVRYDVLAPSVVGAIFRFVDEQPSQAASGLRAEVLLSLLYFDMLSLGEAISIRMSHLDLPTGRLSLANGRSVLLSRETRASISALLGLSRRNPSDVLLASRSG